MVFQEEHNIFINNSCVYVSLNVLGVVLVYFVKGVQYVT